MPDLELISPHVAVAAAQALALLLAARADRRRHTRPAWLSVAADSAAAAVPTVVLQVQRVVGCCHCRRQRGGVQVQLQQWLYFSNRLPTSLSAQPNIGTAPIGHREIGTSAGVLEGFAGDDIR